MVTLLLQTLAQQQKDSSKKGYLNGIFASKRFHHLVPYTREDENIFFSTAIAFTLQEYAIFFSEQEQLIAKNIINKVKKCYPNFKNFKGGFTYNFFKTNPMGFFPNGNIMQHFNFFKLADDADDTVYVFMTDAKNKNHTQLKQKLTKHANGTLTWNKHVEKKHQNLKVYSVYFGEKMPIEIDTCVLCNILIWVNQQKLTHEQQDIDSLKYLTQVIVSKDYIHKPYLTSPCYPTTAQICYHITRLIKKTNLLSNLKPLLVKDINMLIEKPQSFISILFYHIALLNLNAKPAVKLKYSLNETVKNASFFYTAIPLMIPKLWIRKLQKYQIFNCLGLRTKCDGYTTALLLEYELLWKNKS